ncbi:MAG: Hpt domain-containing protein [Lachnospiraceae bacterium]|nr:Hpt domain-containing protein [Lachnospiraceae bacterium]
MTLKDFYDKNGSLSSMMATIPSEAAIQRLLGMLLQDQTMEELKRAVASGDVPLAFRAAHTLKGTLMNLQITGVQKKASDVTEALRNASSVEDAAVLLPVLEEDYNDMISDLKELVGGSAS